MGLPYVNNILKNLGVAGNLLSEIETDFCNGSLDMLNDIKINK